MARIMILGAGTYQVPLIRTAQRMGHQVIAVSRQGNYPGFDVADESLFLDTTDAEGILAAARARNIGAITTTGTDVAVPALGAVCDALGLPGPSVRATRLLTDKAVMKKAFCDNGITTSPFRVVHDESEALAAAEELGLPVMVKACDVSGSRGVVKAASPDEVRHACAEAMSVTRTDHIIVEGYVEGVDFGFEAFVSGGSLALCLTHDKSIRMVEGVAVSCGHAFPAAVDAAVEEAVAREVRAIVAATGVDNTAIDGDVRLAPDGSVWVIEAAARCGATCIPELITLSCGVDFYECIIRNALGERVAFPDQPLRSSMAELLFSECGGVVQSIDEERLGRLRAQGVQVSLDVSAGDAVRPMRNGTDRYGQVIMATADRGRFAEAVAEAEACVRIA